VKGLKLPSVTLATWARMRFDHQTDHQTLPVATRSERRNGPPIGEAVRKSEKPVARQGTAVTHVSAASRTLSSKAGDAGEPCPEVRLGRQRHGGDPQAQPSVVRGGGLPCPTEKALISPPRRPRRPGR